MINVRFLLVLLPLLLAAKPVYSIEVNTVDILSTPITDRSCHNYCVVGFCVWLKCTPFGCKIRTTPRVRHHNPDLVISLYENIGDNPWTEAKHVYGPLEEEFADGLVGIFHDAQAGHGHRTEGGSPLTDQSLRYKEAAAIGHPLSSLGEFFAGTEYFCPSEASSFYPYFFSAMDALSWRLGIPDGFYLHNLLPGIRVVGEGGFFQQWGPLWPRTGFVNQKDDARAAAVIAQRVANIVTQLSQPHVYSPLNGNGYSKTWLPGELIENREDTGRWQMVAPVKDKKCYVFGRDDESWSTDRISDDNRYVFNLWRPYDCCRKRGSLIYTVDNWEICL